MQIEFINLNEHTVFREQIVDLIESLQDLTKELNNVIEIAPEKSLDVVKMPKPCKVLDNHLEQRGELLTASEGNTLYGVALLNFDDQVCYVNKLVARSSGLGIGKKLFKEINKECLTRGIKTVYLDCHSENELGLGFYESLGMKVLSQRMVLELSE